MSQGFLIWKDFHPVLVGAGCLALGYVYGRHCRAASEIPADELPASEDACCARESQSNACLEDLERCKCCISAPAELDTTMAVGKGKGLGKSSTRSPYMIQDAAEGFQQAERSTKRDLGQRTSMDHYGHYKEELDGEAHGMMMRQHSSNYPYFERSYQMLEEEQVMQLAKTPYKKQKGTVPVVKEPNFCSKGKAEMGRVGDDDDGAGSVPWSQEVLNKRIDYFNNVTSVSETTDSGRSDESRKLRHFKKNFLKVSASSKGEATYNSISTNSQKSTSNSGPAVERSTYGLVPLATPDHVNCSHDNSPNSPHGVFSGGCKRTAITPRDNTSDVVPQPVQNFIPKAFVAPETLSIVNRLHIGNGLELGDSKDTNAAAQPSYDSNEKKHGNGLDSTTGAAPSQTLSTSQALEYHVPDKCSGGQELKKEVPIMDKVLKAEIYELLNEADCSKVSFQEIVSLLEERLQTDLQESKAHIATLVHEVISISKLLEEGGLPSEVESEQDEATGVHKDLSKVNNCSSSSNRLGKLHFLSNFE